ncbi:MAG: protein kinase [Acidobacteriota bacterium]|nr:protein kinase [Acidobacteriota bacterium]
MLAQETLLQNRYRIVRLLGQGGMGAVYDAMDERLDTTVALKETLFTDERLRKQFEREARLLARMHHPALPRVSDHFSEGEGQFLVMQFIAGDDLAQMIKNKQGPFPTDQVLTWGDQLLDALDYLHTQDPQIIHRDIKPQNLKLTSRGQIILLDFGLAKGQAGGISVVTTSASIYGYTPNYAPLEQIQGLGTDARSDIYALSATLYHLMTGVKPPDALTRAAALVNGQPDPLIRANEINSSIDPEVANVLARAMSQNREQRFPTAAAMRAALKASREATVVKGAREATTVLFGSSSETLTDSTRTRLKETTRPHPNETVAKRETATVVHAEDARKDRRFAPWAIGVAAVLLVGLLFGGFYAYQLRNNLAGNTDPVENGDQGTGSPIVSEPAAGSTTSTEPLASPPKEEKNPAASAVANEPIKNAKAVKNSEKAARNNDKVTERPTTSVYLPPLTDETAPNAANERAFPKNTPAQPLPESNSSDLSPLNPSRRRIGGVAIRNFPDGTQIVTSPDGTRVLIMPNGTRRVFRPGEKINRRNRLP